jgi:transcriptional regulator with XRE-family HTH domain
LVAREGRRKNRRSAHRRVTRYEIRGPWNHLARSGHAARHGKGHAYAGLDSSRRIAACSVRPPVTPAEPRNCRSGFPRVPARKARGFTQTELGEFLGVSQRVVTYYERESGRPPAHLLPRLADALNVTVDELVGYERLKEARAPRNARLWRKLREIEKLGEADRKAVLRFVDALLAKQRLEHQRG